MARARGVEVQAAAVLRPAVATAAARAGARRVGLVGVGPVGIDTHLDRVRTVHSGGPVLGDPDAPVRLSCATVGEGRVPGLPLPPVVARVRADRRPVDVADPEEVHRLRAALDPDDAAGAERLEQALAVLRAEPPLPEPGDVLAVLPDALARVPADALPVVTTTWTLARLPPATRPRFLRVLADVAADRPVAWVSLEGVGVAPGVPTLGDRPASGHSLVGVTLLDGSAHDVGVVARCWSRGRQLAWLAGA